MNQKFTEQRVMDFYAFYRGQEFEAYRYLGAHMDGDRCIFRTFAPQAAKVELVLDGTVILMNRIYDGNFYEVIVEAKPGMTYEYRIHGRDGSTCDHMDPYGYGVELRPNHKSIVTDMESFSDPIFSDQKWMRSRTDRKKKTLNIYEVHAGSWKKRPKEEQKPLESTWETEGWYTYLELAELLIPYLKDHHYNYIEFLPLCEHPSDESWGYQNTGYFAPTSRYGSAKELKAAMNLFHRNGIGVILDFVPAHFALDDYALHKYDGTSLYEYPSDDVGVSEWGSCNFMHSRPEVRSFLQSSVNYWLKEYHFDGIRMDAVSRLIYWQGDERRGANIGAIEFLKYMNKGLKERNQGIMLIAEDSTNYPGVTEPVERGGLGFDYKWNLGWMHDTLEYFQSPVTERIWKYHKLTFSMMYFRNETYLLPLSHDEVVHGKATILQKMNGGYDRKFPQARALYMYMMVHPGKKLNFMGNEIGHFREWDEKREQDWDLLKYPLHDSFHNYIIELNRIYESQEALWYLDYEEAGFQWLDCQSEKLCLYSMMRIGKNRRILALFNLSDRQQEDYQIQVPNRVDEETMEVLLYSDWEEFGGETPKGKERAEIRNHRISVKLAAYSGMLISVYSLV